MLIVALDDTGLHDALKAMLAYNDVMLIFLDKIDLRGLFWAPWYHNDDISVSEINVK